jgi:hypothetical protein
MNSRHKPITYLVLLVGMIFSTSFFFGTTTYAQTNATTTTSVDENEIFQRGIASSVPVEGADNEQAVIVLPPREDGALYEGTLTFTASKPVEVILGHRMPIDNSTYSQIDTQVFGSLRLFDTTGAPDIPNMISVPSFILPDYGSSIPHFSASIPFVASAVVLGSLHDPFITVYEVSAEIAQPENIINIESANVNDTSTNSTNSSGS